MICGSYDPITFHCAPCCFVCSHHPKCDKKESAANAPNIDSGTDAVSQNSRHTPNNNFRTYYTKNGRESQRGNVEKRGGNDE